MAQPGHGSSRRQGWQVGSQVLSTDGFGKGQLLATRYQHREATDLASGAATVMAEVTEDAGASPTGPESLRRVAARLALDADELG